MTDIYTAIMQAADHIEQNPSEFRFMCTDIPKEHGCGTPGCALGWIGYFSKAYENKSFGIEPGCRSISVVAANISSLSRPSLLGVVQEDFYQTLKDLSGSWDWKTSASECARALRLYAAKYHAPAIAPTHQLVPYQEQFAVGVWDVFKPATHKAI